MTAGRWFLRNQGQSMRLLTCSQTLRSLLAVPALLAMLAVPAMAEPNPSADPAAPSASQSESAPASVPPGSDAAQTEQNAEDQAPDATTGEAKPEDTDSNAAKPEGTEPSADQAATEAPKSSILVNIDKSTQEMTVFVDGVELYTWPVSTGTRGYSTPSGTYTASSMNEIWYSKQWDNAPMPHAVFFTKKGHAIHGTLDEKNLGNAASHGCVRLSRANAKTLFELVKATGLENTQVVLSGTTKGGEGPKVASPGRQPYAYPPPWFEGGGGFFQPPPGNNKKRRRGLFGKRWFDAPQGYYVPPRYYQRRGY
jgi:lipoprotein-anchoring transpeptidase ErfK/SrfK